MAYTPLLTAEIAAGEPTKEELFTKIKNNQDDFDTSIQLLQGTAKIDVFDFKVAGTLANYTEAQISSRMPTFKSPVDATFVSFVVTLLTVSTSGALEIEIDKSTDNGVNWVPLLSSPVELTGTTVGSVSGSVNWVDVPSQSFNQNDLMRLRITGVQSNQGEFHISIYAELS